MLSLAQNKFKGDGSYQAWIYPDGKSKKKGCSKILLRVIEYTLDSEKEQKTYRLITSLLEPQLYPAVVLAREYHQRWEVENTIDELKTHLNGPKTPIPSLNPREVVQEVYGWLLGHWAVRSLMFTASQQVGISPLRLGNPCTLKVIRAAIPEFQNASAEQIPFFGHG